MFDLDGVISDTVPLHARAWQSVFDDVLSRHNKNPSNPFSQPDDYLQYLDGKTRLAGIADFLSARGIALPLGNTDDLSLDTMNGIGNAKNAVFRILLDERGTKPFGDAIRLIEALHQRGRLLGLVSSSKNARIVLTKSGLIHYFGDLIMDGLLADEYKIASKPDPAFYRFAAQLIDRSPRECIAIEDAPSGVMSAKRAGMSVIGVARTGNCRELYDCGADVVVGTLDDLDPNEFEPKRPAAYR